ncbi:MarR family transcriptional regulator [Sphingopyxis sp. GW247-27LB]|uniref:MarR family transcriptional regulator n=1 Tax=Sphingopyxis sp. GW247-27LB TaxID=2012632 RepID=UPI001140C5C8|nr:MarR family transcriptional regulator [Sphingopyxis sp. GW247-27LB]
MAEFENSQRELLDALLEALLALPQSHAQIERYEVEIGPRGRADALIGAYIGRQPLLLLVEIKAQLFPRDVREAIWQLRNNQAHLSNSGDDREIIPFFVARAISPGAREIFREERVGYYDLGGSLYIPGKKTFIFLDKPAPKKGTKKFDSIFQGQKARALHEIYERRQDWLGVKDLADASGVSPATASETLTELERREWVDVQGAGPSKQRRLRAARPLLEAWTSYASDQKAPTVRRYYVPKGSDALELALRLDQACDEAKAAYAVTGEVAAQIYAPYLSSISQLRCRIEPGQKLIEALLNLDARPVAEGWNLGIIEAKSRRDVAVGQRIDGVCYAPPLQVYLDLLQASGRSREMAMHLRSECLDVKRRSKGTPYRRRRGTPFSDMMPVS